MVRVSIVSDSATASSISVSGSGLASDSDSNTASSIAASFSLWGSSAARAMVFGSDGCMMV